MYALLEMSERAGLDQDVMLNKNEDLDTALLNNLGDLQQNFQQRWTGNHDCDVPQCKTTMISDGGQKIDRAVCAQKFSMLKKNKHTNKYVLVCEIFLKKHFYVPQELTNSWCV